MRIVIAVVLLSGVLFPNPVAADWPTYLGGNQRSGSTDEKLDLPLRKTWTYKAPARPVRAWSGPEGRTVEGKELRDRVKFDDAMQVAVAGDRVFFGSMVDHQVYCLDAKTGKTLWSTFTGGPVRLAPTVADGRVYVGSDDGHAYCLDASDGSEIWKLRLGPADEWIIGRGEMISRWPVRTGILVDDGVAYIGAGVFPHENVYIAAVEADSGKVVWRNDGISHADAGRNDLSPQGYLLATSTALYVPSGRSRPRAVNRKTGEITGSSTSSLAFTQTIIAGTDALVANDKLHLYSLGTRFAVRGDASYAGTGSLVMKMNTPKYAVANARRKQITSQLRTLSRQLRNPGDKEAELKAQVAKLEEERESIKRNGIEWRAETSAEASLIVADGVVLAGDDGQVTAFEDEKGKQIWQAEVAGAARGLAIAAGRLYVSTTEGEIICFSSDEAAAPADLAKADSPFDKDDLTAVYEQAAKDILARYDNERGYCLVVGSEEGRLAYELAKRSELKIYAVEPNAAKVERSRRALAAAGLYGSRVTVHQADLANLPYSNYSMNLIVSDTLVASGKLPVDPNRLTRLVKPAGGVVVLGQPTGGTGADVTQLEQQVSNTDLGDSATAKRDGTWVQLTRGTLPGAGNWSHQYAEPGNTANSGDKLVKGGMGVLWYGDPGPGMMVNRHQGAVGPLVVNGRMFVQGEDSLMAYDAYNGLFLWQVANPKAIRTGVFMNKNPGNLAASDDRLFHMVREQVYEHDAATGKVLRTHALPESVDSKTHEWGYLAVRDGLLIGTATTRPDVIRLNERRRGDPGKSATDSIFAIDLESGKHLWAYPDKDAAGDTGTSINFQTIALGPNRVFFIDSTITSEQRQAILEQDKSELKDLTGDARKIQEDRMKKLDARTAVAVEARTGKQLWAKPVDVTDCSDIGIGGGKLTMMYHDDTLILCGANANGHYWRQFVAGDFNRRRLVALNANDGYEVWDEDANYRHRPIIVGNKVYAEPWAFELKTGKQLTREHPLTGNQVPWSIMRPGHHCGMLTASDNLLLFRSGYTGFYDLESDSGTRHFAGHRLGCWINAIPTNGLVVIPEASAGCVCMFSIASTIVMEPREARRPWTLYSAVGAATPVKQMALNLGAPGDRRDEHGKLWLAYPRPTPNTRLETSLDLKLDCQPKFASGGGFFSDDGDNSVSASGWIAASGARGLTSCSLPLLGEADAPTLYRVRLLFNGDLPADGDLPVALKLQGKQASGELSTLSGTGEESILVYEVDKILVENRLAIDLDTGESNLLLCGIEVIRFEASE